MKSKRLTTKCFALLLSLALLISLLPVTVYASELQPWAADAVDKLNTVYGSGTFTADNVSVTVAAVKNLLTSKFSYSADSKIITDFLNTGTYLSRKQLAQVVCSLYGLAENLSAGAFSDCNDPAAVTLHSLGIVAGKSDGTFAPDDITTNAELAVIFYRALGKVGAGGNTLLGGIKPGMYGYEELMYLATRSIGIPNDFNTQVIGTATLPIWNSEEEKFINYTGKDNILGAWCTRLAVLPPDSGRTSVTGSVYEAVYAAVYNDTSVLDAAVLTVAEDRQWLKSNGMGDRTGIFSDVNPGDWFYDGVMYLFNNDVVHGYGDGCFRPNDMLTRAQMAAVLCKINHIDTSKPAEGVVVSDQADIPGWAYNSVTHAVYKGYMTYNYGTYFKPNYNVTRQEAALAIFKSYNGYNADNVNLSVLDRFSDGAGIGEAYKTGMAYLVSSGVIKGSADGHVMPEIEINRASFGLLLSRVMMGLDKSRMHDYQTTVTEVLQ